MHGQENVLRDGSSDPRLAPDMAQNNSLFKYRRLETTPISSRSSKMKISARSNPGLKETAKMVMRPLMQRGEACAFLPKEGENNTSSA